MSRSQRLTFLAIAALIAVAAVFVLADSSEDDPPPSEPSAATATPTPTTAQELSPQETPEPTPEPTPTPTPLLTTTKVTDLEYTEGETVRFRVRSSEPDEVHVHGYNLFEEVVPGRTARMAFEADITGIFEIELEHSGKEIARLKVEPE